MFVSLNEIDVSAKRAARGVGLPWGLAEEAGKAARWLCARGLAGVSVLVPLLLDDQQQPVAALAPITGDAWTPAGAYLCPLITGAALADDSGEIVRRRTIVLHDLRAPLLLLPFVSRLARQEGTALRYDWGQGRANLAPDGAAEVSGDILTQHCETAEIAVGGEAHFSNPLREGFEPVGVDAAFWEKLQKLAALTYVPASEHSRLAGAGAGLSDND